MGCTHRETYIKQDPGETPNDRNDRAIRVGTAWYAQRLPQMKIYLLTNDADNRRKALGEQLDAMSVQVKLLTRSDCTVCCLSPSSQHFSACYCMLAHRTRVQAHLVGTWRKRLAGTPVNYYDYHSISGIMHRSCLHAHVGSCTVCCLR